MARANKKNIDWSLMLKKYLYFLDNNDLKGLKKEARHELFCQKANVEMGFSTFGLLITKKNNYMDDLKNAICPVCHNSHFEIIIEKGETIFNPDCTHPICATCLAQMFKHNFKVIKINSILLFL